MIGLDITTNEDYKDVANGVEAWGITALQVYSYTLSYNTLVDEKWTGNEQRRQQWTYPRRKWTLEFRKTPEGGRKLEEFFKEVRGQFKAFKFKWSKIYEDGTDMGGDDQWYYVRLASDDLNFNMDYCGYRTATIDLIEVRNGA